MQSNYYDDDLDNVLGVFLVILGLSAILVTLAFLVGSGGAKQDKADDALETSGAVTTARFYDISRAAYHNPDAPCETNIEDGIEVSTCYFDRGEKMGTVVTEMLRGNSTAVKERYKRYGDEAESGAYLYTSPCYEYYSAIETNIPRNTSGDGFISIGVGYGKGNGFGNNDNPAQLEALCHDRNKNTAVNTVYREVRRLANVKEKCPFSDDPSVCKTLWKPAAA